MIHTWQLQEAKNKLSQVIDDANNKGPQLVTRRGVEVAVVLSYEEYRKLTVRRTKLSEFFLTSPLAGINLDLSRDKSAIQERTSL